MVIDHGYLIIRCSRQNVLIQVAFHQRNQLFLNLRVEPCFNGSIPVVDGVVYGVRVDLRGVNLIPGPPVVGSVIAEKGQGETVHVHIFQTIIQGGCFVYAFGLSVSAEFCTD